MYGESSIERFREEKCLNRMKNTHAINGRGETISDTNHLRDTKIWAMRLLIGRTINRALSPYTFVYVVCVWGCVYVYVMNIYVYICRMHVRRKRLAEHAHRRIPTSRISSGRDFLSGNKFPAKDRLSKQIRTSLPPLFADATSSPTCVPYNVTLVP